jgi:hypothetical protein
MGAGMDLEKTVESAEKSEQEIDGFTRKLDETYQPRIVAMLTPLQKKRLARRRKYEVVA